MLEIHCTECDAVVYEHDEGRPVDRLDQLPCNCIECGAQGHLDVDGDEGGLAVRWVKNR